MNKATLRRLKGLSNKGLFGLEKLVKDNNHERIILRKIKIQLRVWTMLALQLR